MIKKLLKIPLIMSLLAFAGASYAYDCSNLSGWSGGTSYNVGSRVKNNGSAFSCKVAGWCSLNASAYEPGSGWAQGDAWNNLGSCNGSGSSSSGGGTGSSTSSSGGGGGTGGCPAWSAGTYYNVGDKVTFNGGTYIAVNANPGYDPVISTWFWDPSSGCGGGTSSSSSSSSSGGGGSCPAWAPGTQYLPGDVVRYQGNYYVAVHENPGYDPVESNWFWDPTSGCGGGGSSTSSSSGGGSGFSSIMSENQFNQMFPGRNPFYTYQGLVDAVNAFPAFGGAGGTTIQKREVAAAMANFSHETGGLVYVEEIARPVLCGGSTPCGTCAPGKSYYGRGPIQLSWNFNYCAAGQALGLNLWANPDQIASNPATAWKTAIWFWMTQTGAGNMTAHNAIVNGAGFGQTIRTINGSVECDGRRPDQVQSRINKFQSFSQILGVSPGNNLGC